MDNNFIKGQRVHVRSKHGMIRDGVVVKDLGDLVDVKINSLGTRQRVKRYKLLLTLPPEEVEFRAKIYKDLDAADEILRNIKNGEF